MEAVCHGAKDNGGTTIGILPGNDASEANPYVDVPVATCLGQARNSIVARAGGAVIAIDGCYGTLSEIGHALAYGILVIGVNTWEFRIEHFSDSHIDYVNDPVEAVRRAIDQVRWKHP